MVLEKVIKRDMESMKIDSIIVWEIDRHINR